MTSPWLVTVSGVWAEQRINNSEMHFKLLPWGMIAYHNRFPSSRTRSSNALTLSRVREETPPPPPQLPPLDDDPVVEVLAVVLDSKAVDANRFAASPPTVAGVNDKVV